jgi:predicted amidohydrolase
MQSLVAAVVTPNTPPPSGAQLVVFADTKPYVSEILAAPMLSAAARYAKKYEVCLVPQRFLADGGLCLCMFGADGAPLGVQKATHLNLDYRSYRLRRDDAIRLFDTPFGRAALLVDVDGAMPHVARAAAQSGAELLLMSQFVQLYDFFDDRLTLAPYSAARSNGVPVVASVGGYGVICTPDGAVTASPFEESPISAEICPAPISDVLRPAMQEASAVLREHQSALLHDLEGGVPDAE